MQSMRPAARGWVAPGTVSVRARALTERREAEQGREGGRGEGWLRLGAAVLQSLMAGAVLWGIFYGVAGLLRRIPADVHDGVIWLPQ